MVTLKGKTELDFALNAGEILLKSGAETYRVMETIKRICYNEGFEIVEVFVFPTGIIVNGVYNCRIITGMKQINHRSINLTLISRINNMSRRYAVGKINAEQGLLELNELKDGCSYNKKSILLAGAFASAAAAILLGGTRQDFLPTLAASALAWLIMEIKIMSLPHVMKIYLAGLVVGLLGSVFVHYSFGLHLDKIIVGALLPLMPGLAIISAIRDYISGDLLSGTIRSAEVFLLTSTLASGAATGLSVFSHLIQGV